MKENQYKLEAYQIFHSSAVNLKTNAEWTLNGRGDNCRRGVIKRLIHADGYL